MNDSRSANQIDGGGVANAVRDPTPSSSPFQFSILGLLGLMTCVGVATGLLFAVPAWIGGIASVLVNIAMPCVLTTIAIHGQGYQRTFCVGALFPAGVAIFGVGLGFALTWIDPSSMLHANLTAASRISNAIVWGMIPACGLLAMVTRYLVEARRKP